MKIKLKKFTELSKRILPHEAQYLALIHNFQDEEKQQIFNQVVKMHFHRAFYFDDDNIDKKNTIILKIGWKKADFHRCRPDYRMDNAL
jgi:hypothetical protein